MTKVLSIIIISISLCFTVFSQENAVIDSLYSVLPEERDTNRLHVLLNLYAEYMYIDHIKAQELVDEYMSISEEIDNPKFLATAYNISGIQHNMTSDYNSSLEAYKKSKAYYEEIGDYRYVGLVLNNMSNSLRSLGRLPEALNYQMESLKVKKESGLSPEDVAPSYWNIANLISDIGKYDEANEWYRKALRIYEELNSEYDIMNIRHAIALNHREMDSLELAIPVINEYVVYSRKNKHYNSLAGGLDNLGGIAFDRGDYEQAEMYYLESLDIAEKHGEADLPGLIQRRLARLYKKQGDLEKALPYAEKALASSEKFETRKKQITDYLILSEIYEGTGDEVVALDYYKKYHELNDEILSKENIDKMNEMELTFQTKEKEIEIISLKQKNTISKYQKIGMISGIMALLLVIASLMFAQRQRAKRNAFETEKIESELQFKKQELLAYTTQLAHKNEVLEGLKADLANLDETAEKQTNVKSIMKSIDFNLKDDANWENFKARFENVHFGFTKKLLEQYPDLSNNDLRLASLLRMEMNTKEIANLLNISQDGIKKARYRLRKKLALESSVSLENTILSV